MATEIELSTRLPEEFSEDDNDEAAYDDDDDDDWAHDYRDSDYHSDAGNEYIIDAVEDKLAQRVKRRLR